MFEWGYLTSAVNDSVPTVYRCNGVEVARLCRKVTGEWHATLNQHLPGDDPARRSRDCRSFETGKVGVEAWAERHRERLEAETAEIDKRRPYRSWMPSGQRD